MFYITCKLEAGQGQPHVGFVPYKVQPHVESVPEYCTNGKFTKFSTLCTRVLDPKLNAVQPRVRSVPPYADTVQPRV